MNVMHFPRLLCLCCIISILAWGCASGDIKSDGTPNSQNTDDNTGSGDHTDSGDHTGTGDHTGSGDHTGTGDNTGDTYQLPADRSTWTAEDWARARISQTVSTEEAFEHISNSTGFPIQTKDDKLLFMHWYDHGNWALAGDLNNWQTQAMTREGDILYIEVENSAKSEDIQFYKFVNTDDNSYHADPWSLYYDYDENGQISYVSAPKNHSYLMRWNAVKSPQGLKTRAVRAWVPANSGPYKVLYAHDGAALWDLDNGTGGWSLRQNLACVYKQNETCVSADYIVVGIDNTSDRMNEYIHVEDAFDGTTYAPKGDLYADFVENTVRPMIEKRFETKPIAGVMGSSLGGLISLYIAHLYPGRYQAVLALSPTTAWGDFTSHNKLIKDYYVEDGHRNILLYLDNGGNEGSGCKFNAEDAWEDEQSRDNYCYTRAFVDKMDEIGYTWDKDLFHQFKLNAEHNEGAWAARVAYPLSLFKDLK